MNRVLVISLTLLLAGCDSVVTPDRALDAPGAHLAGVSATTSNEAIEGHYVVLLSRTPAVRDGRADAALEAVTSAISRKAGARVNHVYRHALTGFAAELTDGQAEELRRDPRVLSVEQDAYAYAASSGGVQEYATWGLDRIDQREGPLDRVYAYTATGAGVTAYVIDSGMRFSHSEFGGRASFGADFVVEDNLDSGDDCAGHGTYVGGTLGGSTYGVAKGVDLISVRVLGCDNRGAWSWIIAGVDWVAQDVQENDRLPAIANMSIGGGVSSATATLEAALQNSIDAGVTYVVAAGNWDSDACNHVPARYPGALTVAASDVENKRALFSNYGSCVDLYAPGVAVTSASHLGDASTRTESGTSASAPHVAGVVALYLEANPQATPADVFSALLANTTPNAVSGVPSGSNNLVYSLWEEVAFTPPPAPDLNLAAAGLKVQGKQTVDLTWSSTTAAHVRVLRDRVVVATAPNSGSYRDNTGTNGNDGTYVHQVCELGYDNCSAEITTVFGDRGGDDGGTEPPPGDGPTASFIYSCGNSPTCQFTDTSTGNVAEWSWTSTSGHSSDQQYPSFTFNAAGNHTVTLSVTGSGGSTDQASTTLNCKDHPRHGLRCS